MLDLLIAAALILGPILLVAGVGLISRAARFRWANVLKLYLTLLFGFFGVYAHLMHPQAVVDLIPPVFPIRLACSYASGALELAFAVLIWTRNARLIAWVIIAYLALVLPFNIYGWTIAINVPSYINAPFYLWLRVPMQAVFIAFAYFGTLGDRSRSRLANLW